MSLERARALWASFRCNKNSVTAITFVSVLKAEIFGVDCTAVTPCVEHARCDRKTGQCLCDKDYSVRWDGLCGECFMPGILSLFVGIAQPGVSALCWAFCPCLLASLSLWCMLYAGHFVLAPTFLTERGRANAAMPMPAASNRSGQLQ